jgi:hypothetical protein
MGMLARLTPVKAIRKIATVAQKPTLLAMDAVLDGEIVDKVISAR